jgi:hypothetical protein
MVSIFGQRIIPEAADKFCLQVNHSFLIPVKWLFYHYKIGNLQLTDSPSNLIRNAKMTDTVLIDLLSDFDFMDDLSKFNYEYIINKWDGDRKWIGLLSNDNYTQTIHVVYEKRKVMETFYNCLYYVEDGSIRCRGSAKHEFYYNRRMLDHFGTKLPINLISLAPIFGEDNIIS